MVDLDSEPLREVVGDSLLLSGGFGQRASAQGRRFVDDAFADHGFVVVVGDHLADGGEGGADDGLGARARGLSLEGLLERVVDLVLVDGEAELGLVGEVAVERPRRDVGLRGDVGHGDRVVSALGEQARPRGDEVLSCSLLLSFFERRGGIHEQSMAQAAA